MKKRLMVILLSILCINCKLYSQEVCKVLKVEIADKYEGKCKNGLANGKGVAEGKDKYEGAFKNGLPHGNGKYIYASGEVFEGKWKNGKKEGEGKLFYKKDGIDSMKIGVWENDLYVRKITPPSYKVLKTTAVGRYSIHRVKDGNRVLVALLQNSNTNGTVSNLVFSPSSGTETEVGSYKGFENIVFPFKCKVTYSTQNLLRTANYEVSFEFEINQEGEWEIKIDA
ncbi:MAG: hypothetical protein EHM93_17005 [Bacteroidales bacterium]|nr:MAG: hypothetical protein EHM93_17005 [Bacteroidales bacterium]